VFVTSILSVTRPRRKETAAMSSPHSPKQNHLLAALPAEDYARLLPDLELIAMPLGWALYESGAHMGYLYFPTTSIVSLLYVMESGASAEIAITGNDGLVGISLFMGGESTPSRAVVQSAGNGYRLKASILKREFALGGQLQHLALRYTQALITQMAQTAVCNRHHAVDQQLCRWLLLSLDRLPSNELMMTQELIANMLGVRREGVTEAAGKLQAAGLIHYYRGRITVLDRTKLEQRVCECYAVVKKEFDRLLPYKLVL
jgi:CRP-like cAMP-binding protein